MAYVLAAMFVIGGALFALLGYSNLVSTRKKRATWLAVEGTVIDFAEVRGDKGRTLYAPVYRYTLDGNHYTATSRISSSPPDHNVGDSIRVLVNPARKNDSDVLNGSVSVFTYGMVAMGVLAVAVGVFVAWLAFTGQMTFE